MKFASVVLALVLVGGSALAAEKPFSSSLSAHTSSSDQLLLPANYRSWVALSPSTPGLPSHQHQHIAGKLFVEPTAYEHFTKTGVWPNRTVIVLEMGTGKPMAKGKCDVMGLEVALKNDSHFPDPWSYYGIVYDRPQTEEGSTKLASSNCVDCDQPLDIMLAMAYPTLRAVINAKPSAMSPGLF